MSATPEVGRRRTRCPRCDAPLATVKSIEAPLAGCGRCRGVWLDRKALEAITARPSASARLGAAREPRGARSAATQRIKCPICYYWMEAKNFENCPDLTVDVCRRHGTWLDANELQAMLRFLKAGQNPARTAIPTPSAARPLAVSATAGGVVLASGAVAAHEPARRDYSTLEQGVEIVLELVDLIPIESIGDLGDVAAGVAEIGAGVLAGI